MAGEIWYFDKYYTTNDLVAKLYWCNSARSYSKEPLVTGFIDQNYNFSINHKWDSKSDLISSIVSGVAKAVQGVANFASDLALSGAQKIGAKAGIDSMSAIESPLIMNRVIGSNSGLFNQFNGTSVDLQAPTLNIVLIQDSNEGNILNRISEMFGNGALMDTSRAIDKWGAKLEELMKMGSKDRDKYVENARKQQAENAKKGNFKSNEDMGWLDGLLRAPLRRAFPP